MVLWSCNSQPDCWASALASFGCTCAVAFDTALADTNLQLQAWHEADMLSLGDVLKLVVRVHTDCRSLTDVIALVVRANAD